jgi:hypothetical protein
MAVRTKPVRIFEADHGALRLIAEVERRGPADVIHAALAEYMSTHRNDLSGVFARAQAAFQSGDIAALADVLSSSNERTADDLVARFSQPQ